jgi:hypothetical protein
MLRFKTAIIITALFSFFGTEARCDDYAKATQWMTADIPASMRKLTSKFSGNYTTETEVVTVITSASPTRYSSKASMKKSGNQYLTLSYADGIKPSVAEQHVHGSNSRYYFSLERNKAGASWLLVAMEDLRGDVEGERSKGVGELQRAVENIGDSLVKLPFAVGRTAVEKIPDLPGFKLQSVSELEPGKRIYSMQFEYDVKGSGNQQLIRQKCVAEFDMDFYGLPLSFHEVSTSPQQSRDLTITIRRASSDKGDVFDYKSVNQVISGGKDLQKYETTSRISILYDRPPDSDFTLAAYGLPEPVGFEPKTPLYVWLLAVAAICFALTIGFRLLARRRRANA